MRLDTRAAGFTKTPCYFAWLSGLNWPFDFVADPASEGFIFRLPVPKGGEFPSAANPSVPALLLAQLKKLRLRVCWLGIQPLRASEPLPDHDDILKP